MTLQNPTHNPNYTRVKECRYGTMLYNVNDMYVGRSLDLYGEFSEGEVELFRQALRPGDVVIDVGANIGTHTVAFAQIVGRQGRVLAFEPQRLVFQNLCANIALNRLTNVWCYPAAAGRDAGVITVPVLDPAYTNNFGGLSLGEYAGGETVPIMRLDSLNVPRLKMLKVDVEGMEKTALEGAAGLIQKFRPMLYVENDRPQKSADLIRYIDSLNYAMYWHITPLYNPNNHAKNATNVFGATVSGNMFCLPKEQNVKMDGFRPVQVPQPGEDVIPPAPVQPRP